MGGVQLLAASTSWYDQVEEEEEEALAAAAAAAAAAPKPVPKTWAKVAPVIDWMLFPLLPEHDSLFSLAQFLCYTCSVLCL